MTRILIIISVFVIAACGSRSSMKPSVVFQTDFGLKDGAVSAMKGVAKTVDPSLGLYDLTHEIPPYDIWEAGYRLNQTISYWPAGTVFVSVVDPGVGTSRKSVVALLQNGQYIVTPDNGVLTLVAGSVGIRALRQIDETTNRRAGSGGSYTFHGRDVYAYVAARLAAGKISFEEVGPVLESGPVLLPYTEARLNESSGRPIVEGSIAALDPAYGNVWSNIPDSLLRNLQLSPGDSLQTTITHNDSVLFEERLPFVETFGSVAEGKPLLYLNSLMDLSVALNMQDFAARYEIGKGPGWIIRVQKP